MNKSIFETEYYKVLYRPCGDLQTNCYIIISKKTGDSLVVDAGMEAADWVTSQVQQPLAILNTHGHFDHVWSNAELKKAWPQTPIVCPYEDVFLATQDRFMQGQPTCTVDIMVGAPDGAEVQVFQSTTSTLGRKNLFQWNDLVTEFICYPGHTPGNSVIILWHQDEPEKKVMFSGDFIFYRSIGRSDFKFSSHSVMKASLQQVMKLEGDMPVFPGHDAFTRLSDERLFIPRWIETM